MITILADQLPQMPLHLPSSPILNLETSPSPDNDVLPDFDTSEFTRNTMPHLEATERLIIDDDVKKSQTQFRAQKLLKLATDFFPKLAETLLNSRLLTQR